jgi:putative tryptophan/tyrosine transport system ATP-binding protein
MATSEDDPIITLHQINKVFTQPGGEKVHSLRDLDLLIPPGQFLTVIGSNGSGKSTLLNAIAGQFLLDGGQIWLGDQNITPQPAYQRARLIGRVFQNPFQGTCPNLTVVENLRIASLRGKKRSLKSGLKRHELATYAEHLSRFDMGLEKRLQAEVGSLSGGQRQAVTLLMATLQRPEILLLDEHTAALDPKAADRIAQMTAEIVHEQQLTTLMVTHSMAQALELGDRTIMMHQGQIIADLQGDQRQNTQTQDLLDRFEALRW